MLSVIVPAYLEGATMVPNLQRLTTTLSRLETDYEVIVVCDGGSGDTYQQTVAAATDNVRVYGYRPNMGKGFALRYGFERSSGDPVVFIDADMELDPEGIRTLLSLMRTRGCDIVVGSKRHPESTVSYPTVRRVQSWAYQMMVKALFDLNVTDTQTGLKAFRRDVLQAVLPKVQVRRFAFDLETLALAHQAGYVAMAEAPVQLDFKFSSTTNLGAAFQVLADTCRIWWRLRVRRDYGSSSVRPLATVKEEDR